MTEMSYCPPSGRDRVLVQGENEHGSHCVRRAGERPDHPRSRTGHLRRRGWRRPASAHAARRRARRDGHVQLSAQHLDAGRPISCDRARHAGLRTVIQRPRPLGPGGIDTSRRPPTEGLLQLLDYYSGEGPTREKFEQFLRKDLVFDGAALPDALIATRYAASIDPEVVANPPLVRPKDLANARALDLTLDPRLGSLGTPTLVLWGIEDRVNPASGGRSLQERMPNCDLYLFSRTGHWVQWERAAQFNAATIAFLSQSRGSRT